MNSKSFKSKLSALFLLFLITFAQTANARPMPQFENRQDDDKVKKLPPVNGFVA